ncbi:hypothetical protein ACFQ3N_16295 [Virgibacillus byunsanensis]|uniref:Oligopeptide/dipeptide ABC transporter C-terminal domain-containing protein n=1 Tax=Virgibacillus byunsanensis TaxID=570945 RepID=A0ABW3LPA5_9BACI
MPGSLPSIDENNSGCRFHPWCPYAMEQCKMDSPVETKLPESDSHYVRCWLQEVKEDGSHEKSAAHLKA